MQQAIDWIEEAGRRQVRLVAFPEGFIPARPIWYHFHPVSGRQSLEWAARLFDNAVTLGSPEIDALRSAAARARTNVVIGVCEKLPGTTGTMFNSQLFIGDHGELLGRRQKLVPTLGERQVHAPGRGDMIFRPSGWTVGWLAEIASADRDTTQSARSAGSLMTRSWN